MRAAGILLTVAGLGLAGCGLGPGPSLAKIEESCAARARAADGVTGSIRGGVTSNGPAGGLRLTITDDILNPQDPDIVYENCVFQRTGQGPSRPLGLVTG
jgi:hypothetical protein